STVQQAVRFHLPQMHCSSCLWLLENLPQVNQAVVATHVDFPAKEITLYFTKEKASAKDMALLLASLGYEPLFSAEADQAGAVRAQRKLARQSMVKLGIAGFCFANIMMMSFPEYLGLSALATDGLQAGLFRYLNLALSLPVLLYSGAEFFTNAFYGLRQRKLNIDTPIALALAVTFLRSLVDIFSGAGPGYLDSMSGIIFFMLVGRSLQTKTFANLRFNRDHRSYFPMNACVLVDGQESYQPVQAVKEGDVLVVRGQEVIPVDAWLIRGKAEIDYGFVSGENDPVAVPVSGMVYAGGKQTQGRIELKVMKPFSQSRFTQLWNQDSFTKAKENETVSFTSWLSNYFTLLVLAIAGSAFGYWFAQGHVQNAWWALTAV
ncbi:MAG: metal-transporting ATPase, partial [Sphingobacteriia bacterium]